MIITVCRLLPRTILLHIFVNSITLYLLLKKEKEHHRPKFCSSSTHYMTCNIPVDMPHTSIMVRAFTLLCKLNSYKLSDKVLILTLSTKHALIVEVHLIILSIPLTLGIWLPSRMVQEKNTLSPFHASNAVVVTPMQCCLMY